MKISEAGTEWKLLRLLYADDLILCSEVEKDLEVIVRYFVEVCKRRLKVNADKSKEDQYIRSL